MVSLGQVDVASNWSIAQTGDYNGDGKTDILWIDNKGDIAIWFIDDAQTLTSASLGTIGTNWSVQSLGAD